MLESGFGLGIQLPQAGTVGSSQPNLIVTDAERAKYLKASDCIGYGMLHTCYCRRIAIVVDEPLRSTFLRCKVSDLPLYSLEYSAGASATTTSRQSECLYALIELLNPLPGGRCSIDGIQRTDGGVNHMSNVTDEGLHVFQVSFRSLTTRNVNSRL